MVIAPAGAIDSNGAGKVEDFVGAGVGVDVGMLALVGVADGDAVGVVAGATGVSGVTAGNAVAVDGAQAVRKMAKSKSSA